MKWEEVELSELFSIKHGYAFKSKFFSTTGDLAVTTPGHFHEKGGFRRREGKEKYYTGDFPEKYILRKDDLVIAMTEQGAGLLGSTAIIPESERYLHNQRIGLVDEIDTERLYKKYLYYLMNTYPIRARIAGSSTGTKVKHTSPKRILQLKTYLPPLPVQKKIAGILSAYDDAIENNLRRIALLEEAAQNLYREWFVEFRFPGWEEAEFSEGLPVGWERDNVSSLLTKVKRKRKLKKDDYLKKGVYPVVDQGAGKIGGYTNDEDIVQADPLPVVIFGDHTRRVKYIDFPFASGADGTQILYPKNTKMLNMYFYQVIKNIDLSDYAYARHFKFLKESEVILAPKSYITMFNQNTQAFLDEMKILRKQLLFLEEARDILLPRLMSGEISVSE